MVDRDFIKSLTDVADMVRKVLLANGMSERVMTINVYPSGSSVMCYEHRSGRYDFFEEKLECQHSWHDVTEDRNQLHTAVTLDAHAADREDDLK